MSMLRHVFRNHKSRIWGHRRNVGPTVRRNRQGCASTNLTPVLIIRRGGATHTPTPRHCMPRKQENPARSISVFGLEEITFSSLQLAAQAEQRDLYGTGPCCEPLWCLGVPTTATSATLVVDNYVASKRPLSTGPATWFSTSHKKLHYNHRMGSSKSRTFGPYGSANPVRRGCANASHAAPRSCPTRTWRMMFSYDGIYACSRANELCV
jgi:hypothetical protein